MLDALSFALFGKPHRKISKPQLVNSINKKGLLTEVEFLVGSQQYKVVRGIKPAKFEIYVNGEMINQNSHAKEYQSVLEKNIIKLNHKSFHQIVVLGSSSFVPFMQLASQARRDVIEDLLDINMFSKMNTLLKEKMSILKDTVKENAHAMELVKAKIEAQKKYIRDLSALNKSQIDAKALEVKNLQALIQDNSDINAVDTTVGVELQKNVNDYIAQRTELNKYHFQFGTKIAALTKEISFYEDNESCPTCTQDIDNTFKETKVAANADKIQELNEVSRAAEGKLQEFEDNIESLNAQIEIEYQKVREYELRNQQITQWNTQISRLNDEMSKMNVDSGDLVNANSELTDLNDNLTELQEKQYKFNEQYSYQQVMAELLRDTGIKTKIIKQYLPVINNLTNQYLQILDFYVHFDLDESFNETIRSRHRDTFSYDSFSEGEKQRIDLSLLFTWRQVAKMKNSVATNLLILDETFDSSLDDEGVENLMKILDTLSEDTKVFVISHKSELEDASFQRKIEFFKQKNFSKIKSAA